MGLWTTGKQMENERMSFIESVKSALPDYAKDTKKWVVETNHKWRLGDSDTVTYE